MTYGPEYRVRDGKRPAWLDDDDVAAIYEAGPWLPSGFAKLWQWHKDVTALHLLADHWANAPIAAGLEPWAGGDAPPADFKPGGRVMFRDGDVLAPLNPALLRWQHECNGGDIVGYERTEESPLAELQRLGQEAEAVLAEPQPEEVDDENFLRAHVSRNCKVVGIDHPGPGVADWHEVRAAHIALRDRINERLEAEDRCPFKSAVTPQEPEPIDWTGPLVAEHRDTGEVRRVEIAGKRPLLDGDYELETALPGERDYYYFKADGSGDYPKCPWRIRNARPGEPGAIGEVKPAADADGSRECRPVADDPIKRMIEEIAKTYGGSAVPIRGAMRRLIARIREDYAIVPLIPPSQVEKLICASDYDIERVLNDLGILRPEPSLTDKIRALIAKDGESAAEEIANMMAGK